MPNRRQIGLALGMLAAVALTAGAIIASVGSPRSADPATGTSAGETRTGLAHSICLSREDLQRCGRTGGAGR